MSAPRTGSPAHRGSSPPSERAVQCWFPLHPTSVQLARGIARRLCRAWHAAPAQDDVSLAVSELFTNAVREGAGRHAALRMSWTPRRLRVEVRDDGSRHPVVREARPDDESGRGLWLINELAVRWGSHQLPDGKCVWAEFALPASA